MIHHDTKSFILHFLKAKPDIRTGDITKALGISRQTAHQHLQDLVKEKKISRVGSTVDSKYTLYIKPDKKTSQSSNISLHKLLKGLKEDDVFGQIDLALGLKKKLALPAYRISNYAFTEMLNNAIDHSRAKYASIKFELTGGIVEFWIKDGGIGAFESLRKTFHLNDHYEAVEHLMKGKQTTDPARHSGQGIFFTSRAADYFFIQSAKLKWVVDNENDDKSLENVKFTRGTWVNFRLKQKSKKDLKKIFDHYTNDSYEFDKTEVVIRLSKKKGDYVSRSEARRILFGLEQFKRIVLDYKGVSGIGQAFADEVYRVFKNQNPSIQIESLHANEAIEFMIRRTGV